jgi:hypothetical protein
MLLQGWQGLPREIFQIGILAALRFAGEQHDSLLMRLQLLLRVQTVEGSSACGPQTAEERTVLCIRGLGRRQAGFRGFN